MALVTSPIIDRGDTKTLGTWVYALTPVDPGDPDSELTATLVDPDALTLIIRTPAGVSTTYTYGSSAIVRDSEGAYRLTYAFLESGAYTYEWRSTNPSQVQGETIQVTPSPLDVVVGTDDPYFTIGEARQLPPLGDEEKYPDSAIDAMRQTVEAAIEQRTGVAFVPRTATETLNGNGGTDLLLRWPRPLTVTSATVDGGAYTDALLDDTGVIYSPSGWTRGRRNVVIAYTHGYETVPGEIKQAALKLTRDWLVEGPIDNRMTSMSNEDGTFSLATPGLRGSSFGIPFVDAVIQAYSLNVAVA